MNENKKTERKNLDEITNVCLAAYPGDIPSTRMCIIQEEFKQGFEFMKQYPKSVTIFGSARLSPETDMYKRVTLLAEKIAMAGYAVVTGGGHGIMAAANKGANLGGGHSLGINIELPYEQVINEYVTDSISFHHFFSRKVALSYSAEAYIYCPGGFGTLDEMFEILTLKQTGKIPPVPLILFGTEFWKPFDELFRKVLLVPGHETIEPKDLDLYTITDSEDEVIDMITSTPVREEIVVDHAKK
ncbi:TIGR00730 family Rossman fold protein [Patescibacteria group bacterium]|nr:TIGR00730 family Rossman fold protein [Patescibacteria group bacterium]